MRSLALKLSIAIVLPLTIGWKAAVKPENPIDVKDSIVKFLAREGFDVRVTNDSLEYMPVIEARSASCHLRVTRVSPLGHEARLVRRTGTERAVFVFRGTAYPEQPVPLTVASYLWFRSLRELGLVSRVPPVLAVVGSCDANQLPWGHLGSQQPT